MGMAMHGKDREAIEDRRDAMSRSLFSSEVVGRALVFLLSQPLLFTIPQKPLQTLVVILLNAAAQNTSITACLI